MTKVLISAALAVLLTGCASTASVVDADSYSRADMSVILSTNFESAQSDAARALKPSYDKFGAPTRYVAGNMSAVDESAENRLYGFGDMFARFMPSKSIFWEIDGEGLTADVDPIKTVHLLYDKADLSQDPFKKIETEIRRGQSFTVFERNLGERLVVSIYPTQKLPKDAELQTIRFQN